MNGLDLVLLIIIVTFATVGVIKGFISEFFGKGTPVFAVWISIIFYKKLYIYIQNSISNEKLALTASFLIIFIISFIVLKVIEQILKKVFGGEILGSLDHVLGLAFGVVEGGALVCLITIILQSQTWFDTSSLLESSKIYGMLYSFIKFPVGDIKYLEIPGIGDGNV